MHFRRKVIVITITACVYGLGIFFLYFAANILESIPYVLATFIAIHFCIIECKKLCKIKHYIAILTVLTVTIIILLGSRDIMKMISVGIFNLGIFRLIYNIHDEIHNRKKISTRSIIHCGGYMFTVLMTLAYITFSAATYSKFTLTCDQIYTYSDDFIETFTQPFALGIQQVEELKKSFAQTSTLSVQEALLGIETTGETEQYMTPTYTTNESIQSLSTGYRETKGLVGTIEGFKQRLVDQVVQDKNLVNKGICDFLITAITDRFDKPMFQFSVIVLLFILLSPIARIIIYIMEFLALGIIALLRVTKVYTITEKEETVEEIG